MKDKNNNENSQLSDLEYRLNIANDALAFVCERAAPVNILKFSLDLMGHGLFQGKPQGLLGYAIPKLKDEDHSIQGLERDQVNDKALDHTKNLDDRLSSFLEDTKNDLSKKSDKLKQLRVNCMDFIQNDFAPGEYTKFEADAAVEFGVGNCCELSSLAFDFLKNYSEYRPDKSLTVHLMDGKNFDHVFIALAPSGTIKSKLLHEWPADTVIIDPWLRCKFLLKDMPLYWRDMAFANDWHEMKSSPECEQIMDPKAELKDHPFFSAFKAKPQDVHITGPRLPVEEENGHFLVPERF